MLMRLLRALACVYAGMMVMITIMPAEDRPVTGMQHDLEHFAAFALPGFLFAYAYKTRTWVLLLGSILFTLVIELAQIPLPTRHARLQDFLVDSAGMCLGVLISRLAQVVQKQASRRRLAVMMRPAALMLVLAVLGGLIACWPQLPHDLADVTPVSSSQISTAQEVPEQPTRRQPVPTLELPASIAATASALGAPSFPLPSKPGVYALSEGKLAELNALPGKVPDPRVAISAAINSPSATILARGDVKFIVFRSDAASAAPINAQLRMMAKVVRAVDADGGGRAIKTQVQDGWVIRGTTLPFRASSIEGHPEMFLVQPETADFVLPPGRYVLVIKGWGFDFSVDGLIADPQQCVERMDALNSVFYSPCPTR